MLKDFYGLVSLTDVVNTFSVRQSSLALYRLSLGSSSSGGTGS